MQAAANGHTETVVMLIEHGADVNIKTTKKDMTALMFAIRQGHKDIENLLISKGAKE